MGGFIAKHGRRVLPGFVIGKNLGRMGMLNISNLGRTTEINSANDEAFKANADAVCIEKLSFDDDHRAMGYLFGITVATVGQNMTCLFSSLDPLIQQTQLDHLQLNF